MYLAHAQFSVLNRLSNITEFIPRSFQELPGMILEAPSTTGLTQASRHRKTQAALYPQDLALNHQPCWLRIAGSSPQSSWAPLGSPLQSKLDHLLHLMKKEEFGTNNRLYTRQSCSCQLIIVITIEVSKNEKWVLGDPISLWIAHC